MAGKPKPCRGLNWVLTLNNPIHNDLDQYKQVLAKDRYKARYHCIADDYAPTTNTHHWHAMICFEKRHTISSIKKQFNKWHIEPMRGTASQAREYTIKYYKEHPESFMLEEGDMPKDTRITTEDNQDKWESMFHAAKKGKFDEIPPKEYIRYHKAFREIYIENQKASDMPPNLDMKEHFLWLWGSTGNGKSYAARHDIKDRIQRMYKEPVEIYLKTLNKWWDHYSGEKIVLIEEANPDACEHLANFFKTWFDEYAFVAEAKGAIAPKIRPEYIIVTSNYTIDECFPKSQDSGPLKRRLKEVCMDNMLTGLRMNILWPTELYITEQIRLMNQTNGESIKQISRTDQNHENPYNHIGGGNGSPGSVGNTIATDPPCDVIISGDIPPLGDAIPGIPRSPGSSPEHTDDTEIYYPPMSPITQILDENTILNPL